MTNQETFDLLACFDGSSLSKLKLSTQEFTIEMDAGRLRSRRAGDPGSGCCPGGYPRPLSRRALPSPPPWWAPFTPPPPRSRPPLSRWATGYARARPSACWRP